MAMDKYLRYFIKYQSYTIVVFTVIMVAVFTPIMAFNQENDIVNLRFGGAVALVFGISWFLAVMCLIIAIQREEKRLIWPFLVLFLIDLALFLLRELYLLVVERLYVQIFSIKIVALCFAVPYVIASLLALHRLFTVDPLGTQRSEGFVRFDRNEVTADVPATTVPPEPPQSSFGFANNIDYARQV